MVLYILQLDLSQLNDILLERVLRVKLQREVLRALSCCVPIDF